MAGRAVSDIGRHSLPYRNRAQGKGTRAEVGGPEAGGQGLDAKIDSFKEMIGRFRVRVESRIAVGELPHHLLEHHMIFGQFRILAHDASSTPMFISGTSPSMYHLAASL